MPAVNQQGIKIMEGKPSKMSGSHTPEVHSDIPTTLPGLMRVLVANGKLGEFAVEAQRIDSTIKDSAEKTAALVALVEKFAK